MSFPISSGLSPFEFEAGNWSERAMSRNEAGLKSQGDRLAEKIDSGDFDLNDICVFCGVKPSIIRGFVAEIDKHDEIAVYSAIAAGLHKFSAQLDDMASCFSKAVYVPAEPYSEAAE